MEVGTILAMSHNQYQFEECGELCEFDPPPVNDDTDNSCGSLPMATRPSKPLSPCRNRRSGLVSEASMDFGELQDDPTTDRFASGSVYSRSKKRFSTASNRVSLDVNDLQKASDDCCLMFSNGGPPIDGSLSLSSWYQQSSSPLNSSGSTNASATPSDGNSSENSLGGGYLSYNTGSSTVNFGEVPEECLSHFLSACKQSHDSLTTVDENGESDWTLSTALTKESSITSMDGSSQRSLLNGSNSLNGSSHHSSSSSRRRRVKFEAPSRLEKIQEFEKPNHDDFHLLYYTAHELQKMIDCWRAETGAERITSGHTNDQTLYG
mmetsp:Transcript_19706/g.45876  ORF Transcript_19706/g.45876 Transcript_19706/m.45876 type:complete len:321 (-) Transcript_19706:81-1043(-)|eukprot:CAMPEP_0172397228 /NCGR_PEP_ID=MMETSP1061-20121228/29349_1 /TAXON_ID=37318 /ORGANISM="Pseudo-nitzschia pungens, Strain cf. pungens" /LENGTH=320 /DNA_ID=CAMNT_0013129321 /DNA_START=266 /DNA_END=1228 /DNA_ORIENTATION=-